MVDAFDFRASWTADRRVRPLTDGTRGSGVRRGDVGVAHFSAGVYPACSLHGALTAIGSDKWRCLVPGCNAGAQTPWPWRQRRWAWRTMRNPALGPRASRIRSPIASGSR